MTRANLIALLKDHLGVLDNVELRDYNKESAADRIKGISESEEERAVREENLYRYKEAMVIVNNLKSMRIEDKLKAIMSCIVVLNYHMENSRSYTESFLILNTKSEFDKIVSEATIPKNRLKNLMKTYLVRRTAIRTKQCHKDDENRANMNGSKNHPIKKGKNTRRPRR
ncbi:MAG: hypothetical protein MHMPM18_003009 [Marteilia pararefringens]